MKSARLLTMLLSGALLAATSCGSGGTPKLSDTPVSINQPTAERPIVFTAAPSAPYHLGLLFGGADGTRRVELRRTMQMHGVTVCPNGKLAAVVESNYRRDSLRAGTDEWSRWLSIYDVDGGLVSRIDLPQKPKAFAEAEICLGPRREALVRLSRPALSDTPQAVLEPGESACYYVAADGKVTELVGPGYSQAMFTAGPGYVLQVPEGDSWRLLRYSEPGKLPWEVRTGPNYPLIRPAAGFDFAVEFRWHILHFREDGSYEVRSRSRDPKEYADSNPGLKEAPEAFAKEYLGPAVGQLAKSASLTPGEQDAARAALRQFIYGYHEAEAAGGGWVSASMHRACLERLDSAMKAALPEGKNALYLGWRRQTDRGQNAIEFLLKEHRLEEPEVEKVVVVKPGNPEPGLRKAN